VDELHGGLTYQLYHRLLEVLKTIVSDCQDYLFERSFAGAEEHNEQQTTPEKVDVEEY